MCYFERFHISFSKADSNVITYSVSTVQHHKHGTILLWGCSSHSAATKVIQLFVAITELSLTCCWASLHAGYDSGAERKGGGGLSLWAPFTGTDCSKSHSQWSSICSCQSQRENTRLAPPDSVFCKNKDAVPEHVKLLICNHLGGRNFGVKCLIVCEHRDPYANIRNRGPWVQFGATTLSLVKSD